MSYLLVIMILYYYKFRTGIIDISVKKLCSLSPHGCSGEEIQQINVFIIKNTLSSSSAEYTYMSSMLMASI